MTVAAAATVPITQIATAMAVSVVIVRGDALGDEQSANSPASSP
jgi:hypothetical protein